MLPFMAWDPIAFGRREVQFVSFVDTPDVWADAFCPFAKPCCHLRLLTWETYAACVLERDLYFCIVRILFPYSP